MLTKIEVFGLPDDPLVLPLDDTIVGSELQIKGTDGLGPVKADVTSVQYGSLDGAVLTGAVVGMRNIVLTLGLNPDWSNQTMEGLRQLLYAYFVPKMTTTLRFTTTHLPLCEIKGTVESMDPNIFSKDPEIQVSILCPSPDFVAVNSTVKDGLSVADYNREDVFDTWWYEGTSPAGFELVVGPAPGQDSYAASWVLAQFLAPIPQSFQVDIPAPNQITTQVQFEMGTEKGNKYVVLQNHIPEGSHIEKIFVNLLNNIVPPVAWPQLIPGWNHFNFPTQNGGNGLLAWEMSYFARFCGL